MRQSGHLQPVPSRDGSGPKTFRRLSIQAQSFTIKGLNVCLRRKPPGGFRDPASTPLMAARGWKPEGPLTTRRGVVENRAHLILVQIGLHHSRRSAQAAKLAGVHPGKQDTVNSIGFSPKFG